MAANINNKDLDLSLRMLQARVDELESEANSVTDLNNSGDSGSDTTHWSGEVFFNGRRYYDSTLWSSGLFGTDTAGVAIDGSADAYVKISLDPATIPASVVSYQSALAFSSARKSVSTYVRQHTGALWYNISYVAGPVQVSYPAATWDNTGKIKYAPLQGYVKEDGSVTVTGGNWWAGRRIGTVADSSNSTAGKYAILTIEMAQDGSATTGTITWESSLTTSISSTVGNYVITIGQYDSKRNWTQYFMGLPNITVHRMAGVDTDTSAITQRWLATPNIGMYETSGQFETMGVPAIGSGKTLHYRTATVDGQLHVLYKYPADVTGGQTTMWVWGATE